MPGFFLAVGGDHSSIARRATESVPSEVVRGIGTAALVKSTPVLSLCEWRNEEKSIHPDLVEVSDDRLGLHVVLVGYLTAPFAISRTPSAAAQAYLTKTGDRLLAEPASRHGLLSEINGSYSLIVVGSRGPSILVASDRWASRTVWRAFVDGSWCFASHPALLWHVLGKRLPVQAASLGGLLLRARPVGDHCLLAGQRRNLPGHVHSLSVSGRDEASRWHRPSYEPNEKIGSPEWQALLAETLTRSATRLKGVTELPLLFLSGGLDSRLALAALHKVFDVTAVTLQDNENFETKVAREVATALGVRHRIVKRDRSYYLRVMGQSALLQGGIYHPSHSHFSEGLRLLDDDVSYDSVMLGDFLEAFQKLFGDKADSLPAGMGAQQLCDSIFQLDGKYATHDAASGLAYLLPAVRDRVFEEWRAELLDTVKEALEAARDRRLVIDYLLRWRASYELATYGMIEDVRSYAPERCLSTDNELYDLMLSMPVRVRKTGELSPAAIKRLAPRLACVQNANTMLSMNAPRWLHKTVKVARPMAGTLRRRLNYLLGNTDVVMSSSWSDLRLWASKEAVWVEFIEQLLFDPDGLPDTIFDRKAVEGLWREFRAGNFALGFSLDSLLAFALVHKRYGSGTLF